jgi:PAS domain S-box-containing protein
MTDSEILSNDISVLIKKLDQGSPVGDSDKQHIAEVLKKFHSLELENERLKQNNKQYNAIFDYHHDGIYTFDLDGIFLNANQTLAEIAETPLDEMIGKPFAPFIDPNYLDMVLEIFEKVKKGEVVSYITGIITGKNNKKVLSVTKTPIWEDGKVTGVYGIAKDITKRYEAERKLIETEERLREIVESSTNLFYTHNTDHEFIYLSPQTRTFFGFEPEEAKLRWTEYITDNPINNKAIEITEKAIKTGKVQPPYEIELLRRNGEAFWALVNEAPIVRDGKTVAITGSLTDITEVKAAKKALEDSLQEKTTLLAEIHHRVKNNLAVIAGLLQIQAYNSDNHEIVKELMDSVLRVKSIANVHEQLYTTENFSKLDFSGSLKSLINEIHQVMDTGVEIEKVFKIQALTLSINQGVPVSLIINEVITNIFKHAFEGRKKGVIRIELTTKSGKVKLSIEDDGVGLPTDLVLKRKKNLGLQIIETLTQQLRGEHHFKSNENGTQFTLLFDKNIKIQEPLKESAL